MAWDALTAPAVAPGLAGGLLTRRPDIANAEANMRSAHADLAAARKAFLPDITLTANGGVAYPALAAAVSTLRARAWPRGWVRPWRKRFSTAAKVKR